MGNVGPVYGVFGAPIDTGNLGVSALSIATLTGIADRSPDAEINLFDFAPGVNRASLDWPSGHLEYTRRGAYRSRRFHRPENLRSMHLAARLAPWSNPNIRVLDRADAVLDVSGGDSFTDLYGPRRFVLVTVPKRIVLRRGRPLHLLPQTYGPFVSDRSRQIASRIVAGARSAWARDEHSFGVLQELLGHDFDPSRHRCGVDMAFLLPRGAPSGRLAELREWLDSGDQVIGMNVSGLLSNEPESARERFGLAGDYFHAMEDLIRRFIDRTDAKILLVPHVYGDQPHDSDEVACHRLSDALSLDPDRTRILPTGLDAMETKAMIGACDWFVGARMHATIAALSQSVPAAAVAYSDKTKGVFATCGVEDLVIDARQVATTDLVDGLWELWTQRETAKATLEQTIPQVIDRAHEQLDEILAQS